MKLRSSNFKSNVSLAALALLLSGQAWAKPQLELEISASKQIVLTKDNARTTALVAVNKAAPGDVLVYSVSYVNKGDELARNAVVDDPIPEGMRYVENSATSTQDSAISFSVDGGKSFARPEQLMTEVRQPSGKTEKRIASAAEYTHIRWTLSQVAPGAAGKLEFQAQVK